MTPGLPLRLGRILRHSAVLSNDVVLVFDGAEVAGVPLAEEVFRLLLVGFGGDDEFGVAIALAGVAVVAGEDVIVQGLQADEVQGGALAEGAELHLLNAAADMDARAVRRFIGAPFRNTI